MIQSPVHARATASRRRADELAAFCDRLNEITAAGGQLKLVQIYTVARRPAESFVTPLADAEVDAIVRLVETRTGLAAAAFYGTAGLTRLCRGAQSSCRRTGRIRAHRPDGRMPAARP